MSLVRVVAAGFKLKATCTPTIVRASIRPHPAMTPHLHYLLLLSDKDSPAGSLIWPNSAMISLMKPVGIMARLVTRPSVSTYYDQLLNISPLP